MSDLESEDETQTHFVPQEDDEETLWEVIEILAEKGERYRVRWAGIDPATKKPWAPSWVPKQDCTDDLVRAWKDRKATSAKRKRMAAKNKRGGPSSGGNRKGKEKAPAESDEVLAYKRELASGADPEAGSSRGTRHRKQDTKGASRSISFTSDSDMESNHRPKRKRISPQTSERTGSPAGSSIEDAEPPRKIMKTGPPRGAKKSRAVVLSQDNGGVLRQSGAGYIGNASGSSGLDPEAAKHRGPREKSSAASEDHDEVVRKRPRTESVIKDHRGKDADVEEVNDTIGEQASQEPLELSPHTLNRTPDSVQYASSLLEPVIAIPHLPDDGDGDSRHEIIPETQLLGDEEEDGEDVFPEEGYNNAVSVADVQRSSQTQPQSQDHPGPNPSLTQSLRLPSPPRSPSPRADSRKTTDNALRAKNTKPLRPVPVLSPSAFRPWLPPKPPSKPSQESIEDFSSPERETRKMSIHAKPVVFKVSKLSFHASRSSGTERTAGGRVGPHIPSPRHGDHNKPREDPDTILRDMEEEFLDMTGGFPNPEHDSIEIPGVAKVTGRAVQTEPEHDHDQSTLSSTQQAVVDSQSQIAVEAELVSQWETQLVELRAQLEESRNASTVLRSELRNHEGKVAELQLHLQRSETEKEEMCAAKEAAEEQAKSLSVELEELKEQHDTLLQLRPKDESDSDEYTDEGYSGEDSSDREPRFSRAELVEKLTLAESRIAELEGLVQTLKETGVFAAQQVYTAQIQRMELELARWKGLSTVLRQKDELTNDEVRRRAGEEPELRRKNDELVQRNDQLARERKELEEEIDQYEREEAEWAKEKDIWLEEIDALKGKAAELQATLQAVSSRPVEDVWYVCKDIISGRLCGSHFESAQELVAHAWTAHYGDLD